MSGLFGAIVVALVLVFAVFVQTRAQPIRPPGLLLVPVVLAAIGLLALYLEHGLPLSAGVTALVLVSAAIGIGFGAWRGLLVRVWRGEGGRLHSQGTRATLAIWAAMLVLKTALVSYGAAVGLMRRPSIGDIVIFIALTTGAQNLVVANRALWRFGLPPHPPPVTTEDQRSR